MGSKPAWRAHGRRREPQVSRGYRRILVFVADTPESEKALAFACRLAGERQASITGVGVITVPPLLPLDAHMDEEERDVHALLGRAEATAESFAVVFSPLVARARDASGAVIEQAGATNAEVVVIGGARRNGRGTHGPIFEKTVQEVLKRAPCRVIVVTPQPDADAAAAGRAA
jgi:nucleotide-binding universal stress UspA family protein